MDPTREFGKLDDNSILLSDIGAKFLHGRIDSPPDCESWKLLMTEAEIDLVVRHLAERLNKMLEKEPKQIVLCGILKGVYIFMAALSKHLSFPFSVYFVEASSYKNNQTAGEVELLSLIEPSKFSGRKVILIDELFDNGATLALLYAKILQLPLNLEKDDILRCTLFSKRKKSQFPPPDVVGIILPDVWLVGYGLDYNGTCRGWSDLWALPKIAGVSRSPDDEMFSSDVTLGQKAYEIGRAYIVSQLSEMK